MTAAGRFGVASHSTLNDLGSVVSLNSRRQPDRIAVRTPGGPARTYAELDERTSRLANALRGIGLEPGQRIAGWMSDGPQYVELYVAAAKAGLVMVPVNQLLTEYEAAYQLERTRVRALVYSDDQAERAQAVRESGEYIGISAGERSREASFGFEELIRGGSRAPLPPPRPEDPFMIGFTSGTTGHPKGAVLTHHSVMALAANQVAALRIPVYGVNIQAVSMSFPATVCSHLVPHLMVGGTQVLAAAPWDNDRVLDIIAATGGTHVYVPSPALTGFTEAASKQPAQWRTLTSVLHAGSRADADDLERFASVVGTRYTEGWGMTEISGGLAAVTSPSDALKPPPGFFRSVGRAVPGTMVLAVGEDGQELPRARDAVGELVVRSPSVFAGYWEDEEATAAALRDGWYFTGDLGAVDEAGYIYISDRRSNMIVSGGANVYPAEIELVLAHCPGVSESVVVAAPHARWGQTPVAVIIRQEGSELTEDSVIQFVRQRLASYKKPTRVVFVEELPRTAGGAKIARGRVQSQLAELMAAEASQVNHD
jgi:acyl-CoA synthetase (AMP-forming)/AMP-acid ligase II